MSEAEEPAVPPEPAEAPPPQRRGIAVALAAGLAAIAALVLLAPFWAPAVTPLLPWGAAPPAPAGEAGPLAGRLDGIEKALAADRATLGQIAQRLAVLENRPPPPPPDLGDIRQSLAALDRKMQQAAQGDPTDAALAVTLLQIRDAVDAARPFPAEYATLAALARNRPDIAAAAAPLAEPSRSGVASRTVLVRQLHALAGSIANAAAPPDPDDWGGQILAQLRSLVTIRRVSGPGRSAPETAVADAEAALAGGDLAAAVAALRPLSGPPAEAARPWLRMAEARLAAERDLRRVEALVTARLGGVAPPAPAH
jgi:hypothetical protein